MPQHILSRRSFLVGTIALSGCQTTSMTSETKKLVTNAYDGNYNIVVSRLWNPTPTNLRNEYYRKEPEDLAFLNVRVTNGNFSILRVDDGSVGANYEDFSGVFFDGGLL